MFAIVMSQGVFVRLSTICHFAFLRKFNVSLWTYRRSLFSSSMSSSAASILMTNLPTTASSEISFSKLLPTNLGSLSLMSSTLIVISWAGKGRRKNNHMCKESLSSDNVTHLFRSVVPDISDTDGVREISFEGVDLRTLAINECRRDQSGGAASRGFLKPDQPRRSVHLSIERPFKVKPCREAALLY